MKTGFDLLVEDVRKEGEREKALKIADKLIAKGMSVNDVADATGLTVDEILQR